MPYRLTEPSPNQTAYRAERTRRGRIPLGVRRNTMVTSGLEELRKQQIDPGYIPRGNYDPRLK